jgi:hypothetical protein
MAFLGMRGNGDWATDQRPKNWRETMLFLFPNGDAPLTALLSKMKSEKTDDPEFYWWEKGLPTQRATATGVYTDVLSTAYTTGGESGDVLYVKMSAADVAQFRIGHQVLLRNSDNYADDTNGKVTSKITNGANSYITVSLLEDDPTTTGIADCDTILIIGNINPEGGAMPDAIAYDPTKTYNYTQIFRNSLSITRTARKTKLRTGDQYREAKRECLQLHSIEMEKAFLWGVATEGTGDNGKPERTTDGLITAIRGSSDAVNAHFVTDTTVPGITGASWLDKGEEFLDYYLEQIFRYGSEERMAFVGSGVILQLNKIIKLYGNYTLTPKTVSYGIKVMEWTTPFGTLYMKRHPLFSYEATNRNTMVIFDPADIVYRYIDDTTFYDDPDKKNTGRNRIDGTDEEYLTECGLEYHHLKKCGFLSGFGTDNSG